MPLFLWPLRLCCEHGHSQSQGWNWKKPALNPAEQVLTLPWNNKEASVGNKRWGVVASIHGKLS